MRDRVIRLACIAAALLTIAVPAQAAVSSPQGGQPVWQCWNDGSPDPCRGELRSISMLSASDGWAVGGAGIVLHWNDSAWQVVPLPYNSANAVVALASDDVWAVGAGAFHWDGHTWTDVFVPGYPWLDGLAMRTPNDGWAVGRDGTFHWDGSQWSKVPSPNTEWLTGVAAVAADDAWAIGDNGTLLHWDGSTWSTVTAPTTNDLNAIVMVSATEGWIGGGTWPDAGGNVLRWDGTRWSKYSAPSEELYAIAMRPTTAGAATAGEGWGVGPYGTLLRYSAGVWTRFTGPAADHLYGVAFAGGQGASPAPAWAVGYGGTILRWDGSAWSVTARPLLYSVRAVALLSPTDAWAVGSGYPLPTKIIHWDGNTWTPVAAPSLSHDIATLLGVTMSAPDDGWATGSDGTILRWNGSTWSKVTSPTDVALYGVSMVPSQLPGAPATDGWAVGDNGTILRWNGSAWSKVASSTSQGLNSVAAVSATDAWAVGNAGTVLRWNGSAWQPFTTPATARLSQVRMTPPASGGMPGADGWVVGDRETIMHWNGSAWSKIAAPLKYADYPAVAPLSSSDVWLASTLTSAFYRWNGSAFSKVTEMAGYGPHDMATWSAQPGVLPASDGWAVGYGGLLVHYAPLPHAVYLPVLLRGQ
jgi:hypothetical protein